MDDAAGVVRADCVYCKRELAVVLGVSESTVDRLLAELQLRPYRAGTACPLISGRLFNQAVERAQLECQK